eukprot:6375909-Alexandrium_andersonii.AAC.1
MPLGPADGAHALVLAVVARAQAGLESLARVPGVVHLADEQGRPEPVVGGVAREDALRSGLPGALHVADAVALIPGKVGVCWQQDTVPVAGADEREEALV